MSNNTRVKKARKPRAADGQRREDRMTRWSVHIPRDLLAKLKQEAQRTGRTHARVLADALRKAL